MRRSFRSACDALVAVGGVSSDVAHAIARELEDALALRGHLAPTAFSGRAFPESTEVPTSKGSADAWLEAEIVRHLDLLVGFAPEQRRLAAADTLRILGGPVRALTAWSGSGDAQEMLRELASSLAAAALGVEPTGTPARPAWVRFLRGPTLPPVTDMAPEVTRDVAISLGDLAGTRCELGTLAWSPEVLELRVRRERAAGAGEPARWIAYAVDPVAGLHAGQPGAEVGGDVVFSLRPGLREVASTIAVTVVAGAEAARVEVPL